MIDHIILKIENRKKKIKSKLNKTIWNRMLKKNLGPKKYMLNCT